MLKLRPYQEDAIRAIRSKFQKHQRIILVMATGCGKTVVFSRIAQDVVKAGKRVLIIAHREELLYQAQDKLQIAFGLESSIEKAQLTADENSPIVIASIQTLARDKRIQKYPAGSFGLIIIDEAHHSVSRTYQKVIHHFAKTKILGVTATPNRADHATLANIYECIAFEYNLPQAIREHYLSNIVVKTIPIHVDISNVNVTAGDFQVGELGHALEPYLERIADVMATECKGRRTVVFLPLVRLSQTFSDMLNARRLRSAEIHADSSDRADVIQKLHDGELDVICNAMLLTEGFDEPSIDCIVVLRPTKSDSLFVQMVGRGTRLADGKDHLLLLDFLWQTTKHDICHPSSLIAPNLAIGKRMRKKMEKSSKPVDLQQALEEALEQEIAENSDKEGTNRFLVELGNCIGKKEISIFQPTFAWEKEQITQRQAEALQRFKLSPKEIESIKSKGLANLILSALIERSEKHLATVKQVRLLEKNGFLHVDAWTFQQASEVIDRIAKNHWSIPLDLDQKTYRPKKAKTRKKKREPHKTPQPISSTPPRQPSLSLEGELYYLSFDGSLQDFLAIYSGIPMKYPGDTPVLLLSRADHRCYCLENYLWLSSSNSCKQLLQNMPGCTFHTYPRRNFKWVLPT